MDLFDFKASFEQSPSLILMIDTNFVVLAVTDSYLSSSNMKKDTVVGQYLFDVFPDNPNDITADGQSIVRASINRAIKSKLPDYIALKYDIPRSAVEGGGFSVKYWRTCHSPVVDAENNIIYITQLVEDVTENETLIAQLEIEKKLLKQVEDNENRFRTMMETIPQIAWTNTPDFGVDFFNKRWFEYTGLNFEQSILGWQKVLHAEDLPRTLSQLKKIFKQLQGGGFQTRILSTLHQYRWHLIRLIPVKDNKGNLQLWVGTATDIHELKLLQQQKDDFINIASHELKTPITSLKLSLQLLHAMKDSITNPIEANLIVQANRSLNKFNVLIDDLLDASKANDGQLYLDKRTFVLSKVIQDCCNHILPENSYSITIEGDLLVSVFADPKRIEQIIINFVTNIIKYAPDCKEITIQIFKENDNVKVAVIDKGPGIPKENIPFIFDRYYRVNTNVNSYAAGLGLGLYIASEIIKRHRGQIGVNSEVDKGSTFWFTLPL